MRRVIVIGGGPAGMMAAITAASRGHSVTLMEKNDRLGRKLRLTGGGRCNLCYAADQEEILRNVSGNKNPAFLYSSLYGFGSYELMDFFESRGLSLKVEDGRVFPKSDRAADVVDVLERELKKCNVEVLLNHSIKSSRDFLKLLDETDAVIVATGGMSYPDTGSSGDGYRFARELGHSIADLRPVLVPFLCDSVDIQGLAGLSLRAGLKIGSYSGIGELLFTHKGISGPLVLDASRYYKASERFEQKNHDSDAKETAIIDFMPDVSSTDDLDRLILDKFAKYPNRDVGNILEMLLPNRLASYILETKSNAKANAFTRAERISLTARIKAMQIKLQGTAGFKEAMITAGGVDLREVDPSNMASKKVPNLYFAGEVLDLDAATGGFNLQIAFSTGYQAGMGC